MMMRLDKFIPNPTEIAKLVLIPEMRNHFQDVADMIAEEARANAPVETGDYRDSIEGVAVTDSDGLTARVNAYDYKAWWIEVGTEDTPAFATLRLAAEAIGFHVEAEQGAV